MRWMILIVYSIVLLIGYAAIMDRRAPYPAGWIATKDLAANRLLQPDDLKPQSTGQYLKRARKADEPLQPGDIASFPDLAMQPGDVSLSLPLRRELAGVELNAGSSVRLCRGGKAVAEGASIRAVLCGPADGACTAIVVLDPAKSNELAGIFDKTALPSIESMKVNPACK